jgi:hypothetical protein
VLLLGAWGALGCLGRAAATLCTSLGHPPLLEREFMNPEAPEAPEARYCRFQNCLPEKSWKGDGGGATFGSNCPGAEKWVSFLHPGAALAPGASIWSVRYTGIGSLQLRAKGSEIAFVKARDRQSKARSRVLSGLPRELTKLLN